MCGPPVNTQYIAVYFIQVIWCSECCAYRSSWDTMCTFLLVYYAWGDYTTYHIICTTHNHNGELQEHEQNMTAT